MSTTYAQTIDGNKIYAERSVQDKDGNQIDTTYAKISSLATVATSGDYVDLTNKPTIPSGADLVPSFTLPTDEGKVLTVGSSSTEWATPPSPSTKPVVAGNNIVITENTNNVSISTTGLQPALPTISGHAGDVLTVNSQGNAIEWAASQGGTQVQADWAETSTSDPSYIQNKPTMNSLAAGSNISITPSGSTVTVAVTGLATVATSGSYADLSNKPTIPTVDQTYDGTSTNAQAGVAVASALSGKQDTLTAGSNITISSNTISATDTTYSAGTGIDITSNVISVEAPVDIVAGPGIVIDNPDGNTLRVSQAYPTDETVLYEAPTDAGTTLQLDQYVTLSESMTHFERVRIYYAVQQAWAGKGVFESYMVDGDLKVNLHDVWYREQSGFNVWYETFTYNKYTDSDLRFTQAGGVQRAILNTTWNTTTGLTTIVYKIVGVHRLVANN